MKERKRNLILSVAAFAGLGLVPGCSTTAKAPVGAYARPDWAASSQPVGRIDQSQPVSLQVHLQYRNQQALEAEIAAISDPDSPSYRHFLSDAEFKAKYAPTEADVATVRQHLEASGLQVTYVPGNRAYLAVKGAAPQVEAAFATQLGSYKVGAQTRYAPMSEPSMPAELRPLVRGVLGLHTPGAIKPHFVKSRDLKGRDLPRSSLTRSIRPLADEPRCSEWFGSSADTIDPPYPGYPPLAYDACGYTPGQIRAAYGLTETVRSGIDGSNQTVAIVDAWLSPTLVQDATIYAANHDPDYPVADGQLTTVWAPGSPSPVDDEWWAEQTLDVEAVHATAPGAAILAVAAQSASDLDLIAALNLIIDQDLADIISNSWGGVEAGAPDYIIWNAIFQQAAAKGIGLYFSSGDDGDNSDNVGYPSTSFPASSDLVTAVGGTSFAVGATGKTIFDTGWQTGFSYADWSDPDDPTSPLVWVPAPPGQWIFGAGGGTSTVYAQPRWQAGIVPSRIANINHPTLNAPARAIPDVAMLADPILGLLIGQTEPPEYGGYYDEYAIGGTSLAAPLFAGVVAVAQQNARSSYGFINPRLYKASKKAGAFRDITTLDTPYAVASSNPGRITGAVATFDNEQGQSIHVGPGYDTVTGLGEPNGAAFLKAMK
jgi:subtilase family serine protease